MNLLNKFKSMVHKQEEPIETNTNNTSTNKEEPKRKEINLPFNYVAMCNISNLYKYFSTFPEFIKDIYKDSDLKNDLHEYILKEVKDVWTRLGINLYNDEYLKDPVLACRTNIISDDNKYAISIFIDSNVSYEKYGKLYFNVWLYTNDKKFLDKYSNRFLEHYEKTGINLVRGDYTLPLWDDKNDRS